MLYLEKNHNPRKNAAILAQFTNLLDLKKAIQETEQLFNRTRGNEASPRQKEIRHLTGSLPQKMTAALFRLLSTT
ncbi:hypothetical protein V7157_26725, partial [Neobacillus drentensis]